MVKKFAFFKLFLSQRFKTRLLATVMSVRMKAHALNVTIDLSKRARLFDWFAARPSFHVKLSTQSPKSFLVVMSTTVRDGPFFCARGGGGEGGAG